MVGKLLIPKRVMILGIQVDGFVPTAMMDGVCNGIPFQSEPTDPYGAWNFLFLDCAIFLIAK
ncbi:hypothetical protein Sbs19_21890 [Sphingobium sp. BS19]|nr:hypothetical protein Sbs19_21890 [Sphingobium sp. BS19]